MSGSWFNPVEKPKDINRAVGSGKFLEDLGHDYEQRVYAALKAFPDTLFKRTWTRVLSDVDALLTIGKCTLCGQAIHERDRFEAELKDARAKADAVDTKITKNDQAIKGLEAKKAEARAFSDAKQRRDSLDALLAKEKKTVTSLKKDVSSIQKIHDVYPNRSYKGINQTREL